MKSFYIKPRLLIETIVPDSCISSGELRYSCYACMSDDVSTSTLPSVKPSGTPDWVESIEWECSMPFTAQTIADCAPVLKSLIIDP